MFLSRCFRDSVELWCVLLPCIFKLLSLDGILMFVPVLALIGFTDNI